ncbi:MAG: Zn-dependent oligopeptidase [Planctomycetota bacterium]|nr:Zn-dependent oligopeptidase [Planctomycetota bacterium]MDG2144604.1 Zn-dependent oligopeptidase [Planctomycetota bacterium]
MQQTTAPLMTQTGEQFLAEGRAAITAAQADVAAFKALAKDASPTQAADALDQIDRTLNTVSGRIHLYSQVHPNGDMREAAEVLEREISAFSTELSLDREMFDRVAAVNLDGVDDGQVLRLFEHSLRDFRRSGVDLDEDSRDKVGALKNELVEIGQEFDRNIIGGGREFIISEGPAGLAGLPQDYIDAHPADENGEVRISTDSQDKVPFMMFAERGDLRKAYNHLCNNRAVPENLGVLQNLLEKRHELAELLGFANWADYVTGDKMAKTGANARSFIERILDVSKARATAENDELLAEKRTVDPGADTLFEYERGFYIERLKLRKYDFDSQLVRPYLAYDKVRAGVMDVAAKLYGVEFRLNDETERWHESVDVFDMLDGGEVVARLFLDMHPRDDKFKHAAMFDMTTGRAGGPIPEGVLVCNFPEPKDGDPGLMLFDEVTTYFHEFGHLLHYLFSGKQRFQAFGGIATEWDFVEVPSQLFEEWAWDPVILAGFAKHHETGEPITPELVAKLRSAEEYGKGLQANGQMFYAMLALSYYETDPKGLDTTERLIELKQQIMFSPHEPDTHMQAAFGHLHGYSAMYYTYMWSLVISKDFFSKFKGDLMNTETATAYRNKVTGRGGEADADDLCTDFLGREYGFEAFEAWLNA